MAPAARPAVLLVALFAAGCATGLRRPAITVGIDLDADRRVDLRARVAEGLREYVVHPASVLVSLGDGWHYGSGLFDFLASMKGTHASATFDASVGFVASNVDRLPGTLRASEVYPYLGLRQPPETPAPPVDRRAPPVGP